MFVVGGRGEEEMGEEVVVEAFLAGVMMTMGMRVVVDVAVDEVDEVVVVDWLVVVVVVMDEDVDVNVDVDAEEAEDEVVIEVEVDAEETDDTDPYEGFEMPN